VGHIGCIIAGAYLPQSPSASGHLTVLDIFFKCSAATSRAGGVWMMSSLPREQAKS
jgi:hypothetical protein